MRGALLFSGKTGKNRKPGVRYHALADPLEIPVGLARCLRPKRGRASFVIGGVKLEVLCDMQLKDVVFSASPPEGKEFIPCEVCSHRRAVMHRLCSSAAV